MGDFWDDIKKKNEERRIAGIKSDIRVLEEQIKEYEETGEYSEKPSFDEVAAMILRHTKLQIEYKGEYLGIREMRKHVGWYTAGYKNSSSIRRKVNEVESYEQLEQLISSCIENN